MKEIYETVLSLVARQTGIPPQDITGTRKEEEITDARYLLVHFLAQYFTNKQIEKLTGICRASVSRMRGEQCSRANKFSVQMNMRMIAAEIGRNDKIKSMKIC